MCFRLSRLVSGLGGARIHGGFTELFHNQDGGPQVGDALGARFSFQPFTVHSGPEPEPEHLTDLRRVAPDQIVEIKRVLVAYRQLRALVHL